MIRLRTVNKGLLVFDHISIRDAFANASMGYYDPFGSKWFMNEAYQEEDFNDYAGLFVITKRREEELLGDPAFSNIVDQCSYDDWRDWDCFLAGTSLSPYPARFVILGFKDESIVLQFQLIIN